jgi:hypothetical protein
MRDTEPCRELLSRLLSLLFKSCITQVFAAKRAAKHNSQQWPHPPVFSVPSFHPPTQCRQSSRHHGSCRAGPCVLAGPALATTACVAPLMPSHNVFLCLVALHAHTAAQSATKHKAHYATLLIRSGLLVLSGSVAPFYCSAGNRPNTLLDGSPSAVWPVLRAALGHTLSSLYLVLNKSLFYQALYC